MAVLVSVIVLTYNSQDTVIETLESIKSQTYKPLELVVSDDCSTDDTRTIIDHWLENNVQSFAFIRKNYVEKNTGLSANMNRGCKAATGQYIKYMAADDILEPAAIQRYMEFVQNHDEKVLPVAKVRPIAETNCDIEAVQKYCNRCYEMLRCKPKEQYRAMLYSNWMISPAGDFYPRSLLKQLGGYDERYRQIEDYPMHMKLYKKGYFYGLLDEELVGYRISASSITGSRAYELRKTEMKIFFRQRFWDMFQNGMGLEAIKQIKYWLKVLIK